MLKIWKSSLLDQNKYIITTRGPVRANDQLFSNLSIEKENMWMMEVILNVNSIMLEFSNFNIGFERHANK